jgi:hypothetical protein
MQCAKSIPEISPDSSQWLFILLHLLPQTWPLSVLLALDKEGWGLASLTLGLVNPSAHVAYPVHLHGTKPVRKVPILSSPQLPTAPHCQVTWAMAFLPPFLVSRRDWYSQNSSVFCIKWAPCTTWTAWELIGPPLVQLRSCLQLDTSLSFYLFI